MLPAGKPEPTATQLAPPSRDLKSPAVGWLTVSGSALPTRPLVPTKMVLVSFGSMAMPPGSPIPSEACLSKSGVQVAPASPLRQTPP